MKTILNSHYCNLSSAVPSLLNFLCRFGFSCSCGSSGYQGLICSLPTKPRSCHQVFSSLNYISIPSFHSVSILDIIQFQAIAKGLLGSVMIDLDGGGPIPPARLVCRLEDAGETVVTEVEHDLKEETKVDGFQEPGSFSQRVTYHASKEVRISFNIFIVICGGSPQ